jgi:hypothetical protein
MIGGCVAPLVIAVPAVGTVGLWILIVLLAGAGLVVVSRLSI